MASVIYNEFKRANAAGEIDLNADDIRIHLCMTNSTAGTQNDGVVTVSNITTVDKFDGSGYVLKALANEAVNKDDANDRAEFDADDVTYTALGNGTRAAQGVLIHKYVDGTDANDLVIAYVQFSANQNPGGSDFTIQWNAEGILQLA